MRWLTHAHAMRWHAAHGTIGGGALYQGRFKSFPVQRDKHVPTACRYVERNALAASVVDRAEDWRWGSLWARRQGDERLKALLSKWPVDRPRNWVATVNRALSAKDQEKMKTCITQNRPFGSDLWPKLTANRLGLTASLRPQGRPRKANSNGQKY